MPFTEHSLAVQIDYRNCSLTVQCLSMTWSTFNLFFSPSPYTCGPSSLGSLSVWLTESTSALNSEMLGNPTEASTIQGTKINWCAFSFLFLVCGHIPNEGPASQARIATSLAATSINRLQERCRIASIKGDITQLCLAQLKHKCSIVSGFAFHCVRLFAQAKGRRKEGRKDGGRPQRCEEEHAGSALQLLLFIQDG